MTDPFELIPSVPYHNPWEIDFSERFAKLNAGKKQRIAYFYEAPDNSTFRYRVYNMAQVINTYAENSCASYFFLSDQAWFSEIAQAADMLIICRARYDSRVHHLVSLFRRQNKTVLFDTDDLVFNTDFAHLIISTLDQNIDDSAIWDYWFSYIARIGQTFKICDGGIATNAYLAKLMHQFSQKPIRIIPNFMNKEQVDISERIVEAKKHRRRSENDIVYFGYFSGSPSHNLDFQLAKDSIYELMKRHKQVGLVTVGYISPGPQFSEFGSRHVHLPFQDYVNLQRAIGAVDFNLMPLQINDFTNCKSELKYFEAGAVGTFSIASPSFTYADAIQDKLNGRVSQGHTWLSVLESCFLNRAEYATTVENARYDSLKRFSWENQFPVIAEQLQIN